VAILLLLLICLRRLAGTRRVLTATVAVIFGLYTLAHTSGPLWLPLFLSGLNGASQPGALQSTGWTCGPAALAEALRRLGRPASERDIAILAATTPLDGTTDRGLLRAAHRLGLPAHLVDPASWDDLVAAPLPLVTDWYLGGGVAHEVVVTGVTGATVHVFDPVSGEMDYLRAEFEKHWMGGLIVLAPAVSA
jgi:ABC-type bacteriocin/lantibiotic exporter with double-glycine peptidase domain